MDERQQRLLRGLFWVVLITSVGAGIVLYAVNADSALGPVVASGGVLSILLGVAGYSNLPSALASVEQSRRNAVAVLALGVVLAVVGLLAGAIGAAEPLRIALVPGLALMLGGLVVLVAQRNKAVNEPTPPK